MKIYLVMRHVDFEFDEVHAIAFDRALAVKERRKIIDDCVRPSIEVVKRAKPEYREAAFQSAKRWLRGYEEEFVVEERSTLDDPSPSNEEVIGLIERLRLAAQHPRYPECDPPECFEASTMIARLRGTIA